MMGTAAICTTILSSGLFTYLKGKRPQTISDWWTAVTPPRPLSYSLEELLGFIAADCLGMKIVDDLVAMRGQQKIVETSSSSFLDSLVRSPNMAFEIVLDNHKSHATFCETVNAVQAPKSSSLSRRRKAATRTFQETKDYEEIELDLDDLRDCAPTGSYLHNSYPGREDAPSSHHHNKDSMLCRGASSSDSDFVYVPSHFSFDRMLKEASSATDSARANVSRPVRRSSLKSSQVVVVDDPATDPIVLNSHCSSLFETLNVPI